MELKLMSKSLVLNEALSIPSVIENFSNVDNNPYLEISNLINQKKIKYVVTIARGTSDCAALYSSYIFAKYLGLPSYSMPPSIITLENSKFNFTDALVIVISQSGKSKDLIECEKQCRSMGAKTILISKGSLVNYGKTDEIVNVQIPKIKNPRPFEIFPAANLVQKSANPRANPVPIKYEIQLSISCSFFLLAIIAY